MSSILRDIELLISKQPDQRKHDDIWKVLPWFKRRSEVFHSLSFDTVEDIIRNCELITRQKDSIILKQGDRGDCFFVILSGQISVYIGSNDEEESQSLYSTRPSISTTNSIMFPAYTKSEDEQSSPLPKITQKRKKSKQPIIEAFRHTSVVSNHHAVVERNKFGQFIGTLDDGKSFGELALIRKTCVRNATIITDSTSQLLVVNTELYNRCIKESQEKEFRDKEMFVATSEYFDGWNTRSRRQLAMSLKKKTYTYGTPIVCQGQPVHSIYFLISGFSRVIIDPSQHHAYSDQYPLHNTEESLQRIEREYDEYIPPRKPQRRKHKNMVRGYDICLIGISNMIGDVELAASVPTYLQSVICEQQLVAFVLDIRNYERLIVKRNPQTVRILTSNALLKLDNRALRFKQIPLLRSIYDRLTHRPRMASKKSYIVADDGIRPVPAHGPLIDQFGPGSVFHYIRTRKRQLRKARIANQNLKLQKPSSTSLSPNPLASINMLQESLYSSQGILHIDKPLRREEAEDALSGSSLNRLHIFEEERMNKIEARIHAWQVEVESTKFESQTSEQRKKTKEEKLIHDFLKVPRRQLTRSVETGSRQTKAVLIAD